MILERESELAELDLLVEEAGGGSGRVVLVRGEAGIGKSTLINRFLVDVDDRAHTLMGVCDDLLTPQPFGPLWDVAREEPSLTGPLTSGDRRAVWEAMFDLLSRSLRPSVFVLEDTQWADEATLDLIRYLGRRISRTHGVMVLTYRDVEVDADHPLRQVIGDLQPGSIVRMPLARLPGEAVSWMIADGAFDSVEVLDLTGGNPLFVREVISSGTDSVPISVKDAVLARASKVSTEGRELLDLVSVSPGGLEIELADAILHATDDQVSECVRQGLLTVDESMVSFPHDLQRRAIESSLSTSDRKKRNQQVLDALGRSGDPARLVHHANEAADIDAIVAYAPLAAEASMKIGSNREAVSHFRVLDPYLDRLDIEQQATILTNWATQAYFLDDPGSIELFDRAIAAHRRAGNDSDLGEVLTLASRANGTHARPKIAIAHSDEAIALLDPSGTTPKLARAYAFRAFLEFFYTDRDEAVLPFAEKAMAMAEEIGDDETISDALNVMGHLTHSRGDNGGLALMEESRRRAALVGYRWGELRALSNMAGMYGDVRDVSRATDFAQRARDTAARYEMYALESDSRAMYSEYLLWKGDWAGAADAASETAATSPVTQALTKRVISTIQTRTGRNEAHTGVFEMWALVPPGAGATVVDTAAAAVAEYLWLSGDDEPETLSRLKEVLDDGISLGTPWPSGGLAFWMWKLGFLDKAPNGTADFYGWIIDGEYEKSAEFWHERGIPYEEGLALMHGGTDEQIKALRLFEDLGASAIATKVRQGLADHGMRISRGRAQKTRQNVAGLTGRQAEVLECLARGLTNIQIADELFVSHRTVENHVSAILMKLDVPNRETAVQTAREQGLLQAS